MCKFKNIPSEIREFFKENRKENAIDTMIKDMGVHELSVVDKIWAIVVVVVVVVAELTGADAEILMTQIIEDNRKIAALKAYAEAA